MKKSLFNYAGAMVIAAGSLWFFSCQKEVQEEIEVRSFTKGAKLSEQKAVENRDYMDSKVYPLNSDPFGKSYTDWTVSWMLQLLSTNCAQNPYVNPANALFYQKGPVCFLAPQAKDHTSTFIKVPRDKAILFPLVNFIQEYPCQDQVFEPVKDQSLEDFLREGALASMAGIGEVSVAVDGIPIINPASFKFTSGLFRFSGNPELASCFDACITGKSQAAVTSGYYLMLKPLSPGVHIIHYRVELPSINELQEGTFYITVI